MSDEYRPLPNSTDLERLAEVREIRRLLESPRPIKIELSAQTMLRLAFYIFAVEIIFRVLLTYMGFSAWR